jgi:hypothetical protein
MNKPILGLRKNDPADPACRGKSILIGAVTSVALLLLYGHKVNLLKAEHQVQRIPRIRT